jgi:hypothetical protein
MTITIFGHRITLFKIERLERADLSYDRNAARAEAAEIINSQSFQSLKARAAAIRAAR